MLFQRSKYDPNNILNGLMQLENNFNLDLFVNNSIYSFDLYLKNGIN